MSVPRDHSAEVPARDREADPPWLCVALRSDMAGPILTGNGRRPWIGDPERGGGERPDDRVVRHVTPAADERGRFGADLLGPLVCNVAGGLMIVAAWVAISGQADFGQQLPYVNLGAAGAILAGAGDVVFLLGCRRMIRRRVARVGAKAHMACVARRASAGQRAVVARRAEAEPLARGPRR